MTKQTKLELVQINARLAAECEALRAQVAQLTGDVERLTALHAKGSELVEHLSRPEPAPSARPARTAYVMPQWQADRAAAMAAAREAAMQMRCVVRVGA